MYDILELSSIKVAQLREIAKEMQIKHPESFKKQDLIYRILDEQAVNPLKGKKEEKRSLNLLKKQKDPIDQENLELKEIKRLNQHRRWKVLLTRK